MRTAFVVALCLTSSTLLTAQDKPRPEARESGFVLEAGDHDLAQIIEKAAEFLGRNYLFHADEKSVAAAQTRGRRGGGGVAAAPDDALAIRLQKKLILDAVACEEVVSQLAYSRGFLIVPIDALRGIHEVVSIFGQKSQSLRSRFQQMTPEEVKRRSRARILVGTTVHLEHFTALSAVNELRPFFTRTNNIGEVQIGVVGPNLILTGFAEPVASALELIKVMDAASARSKEQQRSELGLLTDKVKSLEARIAQLEGLLRKQRQPQPSPKTEVEDTGAKKKPPVRRQR